MTSRPARSTPGSPRRSACCPASSCRDPANRSTSASSTSRNPTTNARRAHAPTRTTLEIGAESEVSFATYFNAFPASYWRRWSTLESVVLRVELTGSARVDVYRSKATGARITVGGTTAATVEPPRTDGGSPAVAEFEIELTRSRTAAGSGSTSPPTPSRRCTARAGTRRRRLRAEQRRRRDPDLQPAVGLRQRAGGADLGSVGRRGDRRSDRRPTRAPRRPRTIPVSTPPPPRSATG